MSADGKHQPPEPDDSPPLAAAVPQRLWTPWRMRYVAGGSGEAGCIFCNRLVENDDSRTLILYRGQDAFVIMNLFPYNTGHVMIVPNAHVASPETADADMLAGMAALRGPILRSLRRALNPEGFNLGLNVGAVAGAGVTDHLHEHVVPRWGGDANFMPILAATMVMPELIPVTYAKLRAELERELGVITALSSLVLSADGEFTLVDSEGNLPRVDASEGEPLWRAALRDVQERGATDAELLGWAGEARAGAGEAAVVFAAGLPTNEPAPGHKRVPIREALHGPQAAIVSAGMQRLDHDPQT